MVWQFASTHGIRLVPESSLSPKWLGRSLAEEMNLKCVSHQIEVCVLKAIQIPKARLAPDWEILLVLFRDSPHAPETVFPRDFRVLRHPIISMNARI